MGRIFINATKNFGKKIDTAIDNYNRIDGIYYSLADVPKDKIDSFNLEDVYRFSDLPLYYLTRQNEYIDNYFDRNTTDIGDGKFFTPSVKNNKLICMSDHIDFSFLNMLPITTITYSTRREEFMNMIRDFYEEYYQDSYLMTPTFMLDNIGTWEEVMIADVLKVTDDYLNEHNKDKVILSILLKPELLNNIDVLNSIKSYIELCPSINGFSLTIINDNLPSHYNKEDYKNIFSLVKELNSINLDVFIQYSGIKDVVFSVLDINRFSIGWFGSYRNFDTIQKGITEISPDFFARRVRKILSENFMTEIPLDYLEVLTPEECLEYFGVNKEKLEHISYVDLEQVYWKEILKIIEKDNSTESQFQDDELLHNRCNILLDKLENAMDNIDNLIERLELSGRFDDARKLEKNNKKHVELYFDVLVEFQDTLFF